MFRTLTATLFYYTVSYYTIQFYTLQVMTHSLSVSATIRFPCQNLLLFPPLLLFPSLLLLFLPFLPLLPLLLFPPPPLLLPLLLILPLSPPLLLLPLLLPPLLLPHPWCLVPQALALFGPMLLYPLEYTRSIVSPPLSSLKNKNCKLF